MPLNQLLQAKVSKVYISLSLLEHSPAVPSGSCSIRCLYMRFAGRDIIYICRTGKWDSMSGFSRAAVAYSVIDRLCFDTMSCILYTGCSGIGTDSYSDELVHQGERATLFASVFNPLMLVIVALLSTLLLDEKFHLGRYMYYLDDLLIYIY